MKTLAIQGALSATFLIAAAMLSAFRTNNTDDIRLQRISSATDKTVITYNADKSIAKLVSTHKTADESYVVTRIPVYENGKLVKTMFTDDVAAEATLFSAFTYSAKGQVEKISYFQEDVLNAYDSLVYNDAGKIIARYFFNKQESFPAFESHNCQLYTWDAKGNITGMENFGRLSTRAAFILSSSTSYAYDNKSNAQQSNPSLSYIIDVAPANLSANNIVSETITSATGSTIVNSFEYAYNASQYPVRVTAKYAGAQSAVATELEWAE